MMFHPINSITAYKGQIIYDTPETEAKAQTPVPYLQWMPAPGVHPADAGPDGDLQRLILPPPAQPGQTRRRAVPARRRSAPDPGRAAPGAPMPAEQGVVHA